MANQVLIEQKTTGGPKGQNGGLVVLVTESELRKARSVSKSSFSFSGIDARSNGALRSSLKLRKNFKIEDLKSVVVETHGEKGPQWILLVGWIEDKKKSRLDQVERFRRLGAMVSEFGRSRDIAEVSVGGESFRFIDKETQRAFVEGVHLSQYEFLRYRTAPQTKNTFRKVVVVGATGLSRVAIGEGRAFADATVRARDLVNLSPRDCTPKYLVGEARKIARTARLKCTVFDRSALTRMKAGLLLSVAQGSDEPPYMVRLEYRPRGRARSTIALVGKGVTFDTGGYSLKTGSGMETMKCDMSGAAAVLGTMSAIAALKPSVIVRGYLPLVENMVNGKATRPGDIVKSMNGTTVEILNTDAEGRLILADALTLAQKDGCDVAIDLATLTGACVVALGDQYGGLFSDDDDLVRSLVEASHLSGEKLWRLPLAPEYRPLLNSPVADMKNIGSRHGGAITAALFLKHFIKKGTRWAHLDMAGPAFNEGGEIGGYIKRGGVGFGVRTLLNYLIRK